MYVDIMHDEHCTLVSIRTSSRTAGYMIVCYSHSILNGNGRLKMRAQWKTARLASSRTYRRYSWTRWKCLNNKLLSFLSQHGLLASGGGTADRCIRFWNTLAAQPLQSVDTGSQVCSLANYCSNSLRVIVDDTFRCLYLCPSLCLLLTLV